MQWKPSIPNLVRKLSESHQWVLSPQSSRKHCDLFPTLIRYTAICCILVVLISAVINQSCTLNFDHHWMDRKGEIANLSLPIHSQSRVAMPKTKDSGPNVVIYALSAARHSKATPVPFLCGVASSLVMVLEIIQVRVLHWLCEVTPL